MTARDLQDRIVARLLRGFGGTKQRWRSVLGALRVHDVRTHPHCNWSAAPSGSPREVEIVERLLDDVRAEHPIVTED